MQLDNDNKITNIPVRFTFCELLRIGILEVIYQTQESISSDFQAEKRVENTMRRGVFLTNFEVFENRGNTLSSVRHIFLIKTKTTKKMEIENLKKIMLYIKNTFVNTVIVLIFFVFTQ